MIIEYQEAEAALEKLNAQSSDKYFWDGWTICKFSPNNAAIYENTGTFDREDGWGYLSKYDLDADGRWTIDN